MKKKYIIRLSEEEQQHLTNLVRKGKVTAHKRTHAQILLLADEGLHGPGYQDKEVAQRQTVFFLPHLAPVYPRYAPHLNTHHLTLSRPTGDGLDPFQA